MTTNPGGNFKLPLQLGLGFLFSVILLGVAQYSERKIVSQVETSTEISHEKTGISIPGFFEEDYEYCKNNSAVLDRGDGHNSNGPKTRRPYSVTPFTFAGNFHGSECSSLEETLLAIRKGTRRWVNPSHEALSDPLEREQFQSYFVPYGCDLPYLPPQMMCHELNKFSHIVTQGDSLTRHFRGAFLIAMKKDLVLGGIESKWKGQQLRDDSPYQCRCDGQFSEHSLCRQNNGNLFKSFHPRQASVCSQLPEFEPMFHFNDYLSWNQIKCDDHSSREVLYLLQGGTHMQLNVEETIKVVMEPIFSHPTFKRCLSLNKVRVLWATMGSQSRVLDFKYPTQARENAFKFNREMEHKLKLRYDFPITIIDWWRLSMEAQTSDGRHFLTDVNLAKVNQFIHVIRHL